MVAESGAQLLEPEARVALVELLLPRATVVTPNVPEARALTGGADAGLGTISGTVIGSVAGSAVGAAAGGAAASFIFSGAGALGFIESESDGQRDIVGGGEVRQK